MSSPIKDEHSTSPAYRFQIDHPLDESFWACVFDVSEGELRYALSLIPLEVYPVQRYLAWRPYISSCLH